MESFQSVYGPCGDWSRLFRTDARFIETRLLHVFSAQNKYVTLDFWQSRDAYESFKVENRAAYAALDQNCESLTKAERHIGSFESALS
ncbi:MAG: hypothetical protein M3N22_07840 [Acidobacteriota bacterium]|nr:hypothetical protein [Acidobacteriota bacterium]